jgi:S1-C subfamily serine protease
LLEAALLASLSPSGNASARPVLDEELTQRIFDEGTTSVVSIADYEVSDGKVGKIRPLCSGVLWDQRGYIVTSLEAVTRGSAVDAPGAAASAAATAENMPAAPSRPLATGSPAVRADGIRRPLRVSVLDGSTSPPVVKEYPAIVVGTSPLHHLAVLLLTDAPQEILSPVPLGRSSEIRVGQSAFVLGARFGETHSLSTGVISGLHRPLASSVPGMLAQGGATLLPGGALQTDAVVDALNAGGAVLDSAGRLMGVAVLPPGKKSATSLSFVVPVDVVARVTPLLIATEPELRG